MALFEGRSGARAGVPARVAFVRLRPTEPPASRGRAYLPRLRVALVVAAVLAALAAPRATAFAEDDAPATLRGLPATLRAAFKELLLAKRDDVTACHAEAAARRGAPLVTHLVFQVRVWPDGAGAVRIVDRTQRDRSFERCLLRTLEAPRFAPHASDGPRSILYDQVFTSEGPLLPVSEAPASR